MKNKAPKVTSPNLPQVKVWLVREEVTVPKRTRSRGTPWSTRAALQDCYVLGTSVTEVMEIVGETFLRRIVRVEEACPITQMPADKYRVQAYQARRKTQLSI